MWCVAGGVKGESGGPEAVSVRAVAARSGESEMSGRGHGSFEGVPVVADALVGGETQTFFLDAKAKCGGEFGFKGGGEGDGLDAVGAEFLDGALGEVHADAAGVDAAASDLGEEKPFADAVELVAEWRLGEFDAGDCGVSGAAETE